MWPYWFFFYLFLLNALIHIRPSLLSINGSYLIRPSLLSIKRRYWSIEWVSIFILLVVIVGLRYQVGADWDIYAGNLIDTVPSEVNLSTVRDPGYGFLILLSLMLGQEIGLVNLISAIFFSYGLVIFCRNQALPSLSMLVAFPYMVSVVAMGYTRQSIVIGFFMLGLVALEKGNVWRYLKLIIFATLFHASALLLLPLSMVVVGRKLFIKIFALSLFIVALYFVILDKQAAIWINYLKHVYFSSNFTLTSPGTNIRYAMVLLPALILLLNINRLNINRMSTSIYAIRIWKVVALSSFVMIIPLIYIQSNTFVDRILLYWLPLQLFVYGNIPVAYLRNKYIYITIYIMIVIYSLMVFAVWFYFANNAALWIPYSNYLWL